LSKKKIVRGALIAIPALLLVMLAVLIILLNTSAFRDFLRSEISEQALRRAGVRVEIGGLETHWTVLGLQLNDLVVHGTENPAAQSPPLARAKRLEVAVEFLPLLHGKVELRKFILDQPVIHLSMDSQGHSNLPTVRGSTNGNGPDAIFDLEIRDCAIRSGEVYYNDGQFPLDAEVHDLAFKAAYSRLAAEYAGSLSYDNGRFTSPQVKTIAHAVQMDFIAKRSELDVKHLLLSSDKSHILLNARLTNYAQPSVDGEYEGNLFTIEIAKALQLVSLPIGEIAFKGKFGFHADPQRSILSSLSLQGQMQTARLAVPTSQRPLQVSAVSATYELSGGDLRVNNIDANILGGRARGNWEMLHLDAPAAQSRLQASVQNVSLTNASDALAPRDVRRIHVDGLASIDVRASWSGSIDNAIAHVRLAISNAAHSSAAGSSIPLNGLIQADYDGPRNTLSFAPSTLQTSETKISVTGTLTSRRRRVDSNLVVLATSADLREVSSLVRLFQDAFVPSGQPASTIPDLGGSASFDATLTGSARSPQIRGQLTAEHLAIDRGHWKSLSLHLSASSSGIQIQDAVLMGDPSGRISFEGHAGLQSWSLAPNSPISLRASASGLSVADVKEIAQLHYPVSGPLSAKISVSGTRASPEGNGSLILTHGLAWNEEIDKLTVNAECSQGQIHSSVSIQIPAGSVSADGNYTLATQQIQVQLRGTDLNLEKVSAIQRQGPIQGVVNLSASGSGQIQNPQLTAEVSAPKLVVHDQIISNLQTQITVERQHASITLHSVVDQGAVEGKGELDLQGSRYATASLDVRAVPIAAILANFTSEEDPKLTGQTEIHLTLKGPLETPEQIEAHLEIPTLNAAYGDAKLALAQPLKADYRGGTITLERTRILGTGTDITFAGTIPVRNLAAVAISADGSVDLAAIQKFSPGLHSSGKLDLHLSSEGNLGASSMHGTMKLENAVFSADSIPVGIEGVNAQINLSGSRADIASLEGTAGGGNITATGFVTYGREPNFNLSINAQSVRVRYPAGLRSILSGRVNLQGNSSSSSLTGRVLVDRLSFTRGFDLANFVSTFSEGTPGTTPSRLESNMKLSVSVQSAQDINLSSSKLSIGGSANLNLVGTLANPVLLGRIALTSGEVFFLGKRFEVQSGAIEFANLARIDPTLNLYINTTVEQYKITLNLQGSVERLRTNYTSDPALATADIIHLLAFGNTSAEAASSPTSSAALGAESVVAQGVSSQVAGRLENLTGISQLNIDPLATNSQGNPGAQVAIQERVTGSLLLTFSTDVTSTQSQTVELQYQMNKQASVTVLRDQNGGYGIDLRLHKVF
jgi:translocation and assembly module TamB